MRTLPKLELSAGDYIRIITRKPIEVPASDLVVGSYYKLVNKTTKTYMERCLHSVIGVWSYWD